MNTGNRSGRPDDHSRMTCQRCRDAVSALLDGEQLPEDDFVVRNHLPRCAACLAAARRAREITLLARSWRTEALPDASPDLLATLLAAPTDPVVGSGADGDPGGRAGEGPSCAVDHGHLRPVGNAACGCVPGCPCGCQEGKQCHCGHVAA